MRERVPSGTTLLIGGARSGKSALAVELGRRFGDDVVVIATATPGDDDMRGRIERHRAERPAWPTIEEPVELVAALERATAEHLVILDCLTLWVSNLMLAELDESTIVALASAAAGAAARRHAPTIVISNEVGLGVHPPTALGRTFQDVLGRVNQVWAARAARSLLMAAGRAIPLHDPWDVLDAR